MTVRYLIYTIAFADDRENATGSYLPPIGDWEPVPHEDALCYVAELQEAEWADLQREWSLDHPEPCLGGQTLGGQTVPGDVYFFDPMDWNIGGVTPVLDASLFVSEPLEPVGPRSRVSREHR